MLMNRGHHRLLNGVLGFVALAVAAIVYSGNSAKATEPAGLVERGFIYTNAPFPECHASTLAESGDKLLAAWFGGTREGDKDVEIWLSARQKHAWSPPKVVATGTGADGKQYPCWNPVLFKPANGPLLLFYKVGPSPSRWWGMLISSADNGQTWSPPVTLPKGVLGPIKNKPVQLADGSILCPSSSENQGWKVHFERTSDLGKTWSTSGPINDGKEFSAIQPAILLHGQGKLEAVGRTRQGAIFETWSEDFGRTWGAMRAGSLPNPNSGIDAVTLKDGRHVLVYNHTKRGRTPLNVAVSRDGRNWKAAAVLEHEPGEFSYPAVVEGKDGRVYITYTWKRTRIAYVVLDPDKLSLSEISDGIWPK